MTWTISAAERPSGHWRHQDRHLAQQVRGGTVLVVIDGHGESDDTITRCVHVLPELLLSLSWEAPAAALDTVVMQLQKDTAGYEDGACISLAYLGNDGEIALATLGDTFACTGLLGQEQVQLRWLRQQDISGNDLERRRLLKEGKSLSLGYLHTPGGAMLSLSRALGNRVFRDQMFLNPALLKTSVPKGGFVLLGTDGFFSMSQPERMRMDWLACLEERMSATEILQSEYHALRSKKDDATVMVAYYD